MDLSRSRKVPPPLPPCAIGAGGIVATATVAAVVFRKRMFLTGTIAVMSQFC